MSYEFAQGQSVAVVHPRGLVVALLSVVADSALGLLLSDGSLWKMPRPPGSFRVVPLSPALSRKVERSARLRRIGELARSIATLGDISTPLTDDDLTAIEDVLANGIRRHADSMPPREKKAFLRSVQQRTKSAAAKAVHSGLYDKPLPR